MVVLLLFLLTAVAAEHSGAYSSPQYAKKMYPRVDSNSLLPREKPPVPFKRHVKVTDRSMGRFDGNDTKAESSAYSGNSILESAGSFFNSPGGQLVSTLAQDYVARSTGSSQVGLDCITQVLSLNLTNLVILIVLKALILAAGFFGAGAWKGGHHYGRSLDDNKNATYISEDEVLLLLSYLVSQQNQDYGCLYRQSCRVPYQASLYSSGAELLLQGAKLMQGNSIELEQYDEVSKGIKEAAAWGEAGKPCDTRYKCGE